ncbi:MAG TPA: NAD(P)-dependent alcohol dehydrogenase [Thermoanaerobaculaceae bacterium]|nr:NAD(P)-dependent alcohol dehydrogenase [Thermoanaerobaculaceae bacterium]
MKAIVQDRYGSPDFLELREVERPVVGDDQVLVQVHAASVNAADWHLTHRLPHLIGKAMRMPSNRVRGADLAGRVEAVGRNVTRFRPGDEVFGTGSGSFAEYAAASVDRLAPKPATLTFDEAAAIPIAGCTALQGLRDHANVQPGQRVLVYGAGGGVGTFAVQVAKALGADVTAVTCTENVELVRSIGADEVIDYARQDFTRMGGRHDVGFDVGADRSWAEWRRVLDPDGRLVGCGAPSGSLAKLLVLVMMMRKPRPGSRRVAFMARIRHGDLLALKELAESGKLTPVIDRRYALREAPEALRYLGSRRARGKLVITVA